MSCFFAPIGTDSSSSSSSSSSCSSSITRSGSAHGSSASSSSAVLDGDEEELPRSQLDELHLTSITIPFMMCMYSKGRKCLELLRDTKPSLPSLCLCIDILPLGRRTPKTTVGIRLWWKKLWKIKEHKNTKSEKRKTKEMIKKTTKQQQRKT